MARHGRAARAWRILFGAVALPVTLPWLLFACFWEWWHFGPSQRLLRSERQLEKLMSWIDRTALRFASTPEGEREHG